VSTGQAKHLQPPPVIRETDWEEMVLPFNIGSGRSLYSGLENDSRLRLRVFRKTSDGSLVGRVWFGQGSDGPPGHAHGGAIAYVLDEAMGSVGWMNLYPVVAARLEFQYVRMTPLFVDLELQAKILSHSSRRIEVETTLLLPSGEVSVQAQGEFAILTRAKAKLFDTPEHDPQGLMKNPNLKWANDDAG
jgi:acyl-coenzyme A thioesterase PaaI-like protein